MVALGGHTARGRGRVKITFKNGWNEGLKKAQVEPQAWEKRGVKPKAILQEKKNKIESPVLKITDRGNKSLE